MRIIAGEFRRRQLFTPRDASITRPITDRVKESLFGLLRGHCDGTNVFDAFAGTGAIGLEALSRGSARCVFVEQDREIGEILRENIAMLGVESRCEVVQSDALGAGALARCPRPVTLAFFDPPYALVRDPLGFKRVMGQVEKVVDLLTDDGFVILRTPWPLRHAVPGTAVVAEEAPVIDERREDKKAARALRGKASKGRKGSTERFNWRVEEERAAHQRKRSKGDAAEVPVDDSAAPPELPGVEYVFADMALANAVGPETHVYHGMAVHLYAKKK